MALSGNITQGIGSDLNLVVEWTASQSISNNTSTVTAQLYIEATTSAAATTYLTAQSGKITIDGTSYNISSGASSLARGQRKLVGSAVRTLNHNVYGQKSFTLKGEITIARMSLDGINYFPLGTFSASKSFALNNINRVSTISVSPSPFNFGASLTISISRKFSSAKHTITYKMGNTTGNIATATTSTTITWQVPTSLVNDIPNDTYADIQIICKTIDGTTGIGTDSKTVRAYVPSSYWPTFTSLSIEDANTKVKNNVGRFLKGQSRVKVTVVGAAAAGGATIKSIVVYVDGKAYHGSQITSDVINKTGTINVYAVITDSRNRTYSTQSSPNQVTFYDYFKPQVSTLTIQRCNSDGTPNTKGQYAKVQIQGSYSRVDGLNQGNIKIESSLRGQNNWKTEFNQSLPSGSNNFSYTQIINNQGQLFNVALSYDIRVTITDEVVDPVRYTEVLPTQNVPFDIGPAGAAVGKMWEPGKGAFQVGGESTFGGVINALAGVKVDGDQVALASDLAAHLAESASKHITESGSNDDGYYIKFDDGTMWCYTIITIPYYNANECFATWTYPQRFLQGSVISRHGTHYLESNVQMHQVTGVRVSGQTGAGYVGALVRALSYGGHFTSNSSVSISVFAIGRWK